MAVTPNAYDVLNPRIWTGVVRDVPIPAEYQMERFLPMRDQAADRIEWDILVSENPMAPFVAVDAESPRMDDELLRKAFADVVYIRYKRQLKEHDVRTLRTLQSGPPALINTPLNAMAQAAQDKITRQAVRLSNAVDTSVEWMRVQSLLGALTVSGDASSRVTFSLTYPVNTVTAGTLWTDVANADPIADMSTWFQSYFFNFRYMIASRKVFFNLSRNAKLLRQMFVALGGGTDPTIVSQQRVQNMISSELGLQGITYDAFRTTRTDSGGSSMTLAASRLLPDNKVIFLPPDPIGYTATVPAPQNNWQTGKFAWVDEPGVNVRQDPWTYEMGCGFYGLPVIEQPTKILVATVG